MSKNGNKRVVSYKLPVGLIGQIEEIHLAAREEMLARGIRPGTGRGQFKSYAVEYCLTEQATLQDVLERIREEGPDFLLAL